MATAKQRGRKTSKDLLERAIVPVAKSAKSKTSSSELERIKRLIRAKGEALLNFPNVTGVGVGYKITGGKRTAQPALQFSVDRKIVPQALAAEGVAAIPTAIEFEGVSIPTDVVQRVYQPGYVVVAPQAKTERKKRIEPVCPGVSIGHVKSTAGTLGAIVTDRGSHAPALLSNWHVFCGATGKVGDPIVQPGPFDDDRVSRNGIGKLLRSHLGLAGDCAVASIEGRRLDAKILDLGVRVEAIGKPELGDLVVKSGRTTDVTYGVVTRVDALFKMPYDGMPEQTIGGFEIEPSPKHPAAGNEISKGGDSGSAWMAVDKGDKVTSTMLGLHFGGDAEGSEGEFALACYAKSVFEKLELEPLSTTPSVQALRAASIESAETLRTGFDEGFLDFKVPRPKFTKATVNDLIGLDGGDWIDYCHFTVWLSKSRCLPRCVAWNIDGGAKKSLSRKGISFKKDKRDGLDAYQFGDELYSANDLDRGHVARRDDLVWGAAAEAKQANLDSFYFTNMTPQHQAFNQSKLKGQWGLLENAILDEVDLKDLRVSVVAGPVLADTDQPYRGALLPSEYWKIVFYVDDADGESKARAFLLTQKDLLKTIKPESLELSEFRWYQVPLSKVEEKTGLRFGSVLHALDTKFPQGLGVEQARLIENGEFFQ